MYGSSDGYAPGVVLCAWQLGIELMETLLAAQFAVSPTLFFFVSPCL
jgi:hypothetical protein